MQKSKKTMSKSANDTPCTCGRTQFCPQDCDNMTASEFLSKTQVNHICTCHMRNEYTFCPPGNCQREAIPDKEDVIGFLEMLSIGQEENVSGMLQKVIAYIEATPLTIVDGKGRRFCTCEQQHWDMSHYPDIAQAAQDSDAEAQTIPVPSGPQCDVLGLLLERADLDQRQRIEQIVPEFKRRITEIVRILIRGEMKFYRYEAQEYAVIGWDGEYESPRFPNPKIELQEFGLLRETLKGYWIYPSWCFGDGDKETFKRWVSKTSKSRYAYPTKQEALTNYIKRTERRIQIVSRELDYCKTALMRAKNMVVPETQEENNDTF